MHRKTMLVVAALGLALAGCDSFDPMDKFQELDIMGSSKPPLKGERQAVFPQGTPGVPQGVPPELVKGYVAPVEPPPPPPVAEKKVKPRPKLAARPKPKAPAQAKQVQPPPQQQAAPAQNPATAPWPTPPPPPQQNSAAWPAIPGSQPTWPSQAPPPATR